MSKTKKAKRSKRTPGGVVDRSATTDVMSQLECAARNPQAAALGAFVGGVVPWFARTLAHGQLPSAWSGGHRALAMLMLAVILGCAAFSAISVYKFGRAAFGDARKALGFVLALEGVMLVSHGATSVVALIVLIVINAIANGSVIALSRDATRKRAEADARRSATRAANRASRTAAKEQVTDLPVARVVRPSKKTTTIAIAPQALVAPVWRHTKNDDAIDAEIVSEVVWS